MPLGGKYQHVTARGLLPDLVSKEDFAKHAGTCRGKPLENP